jgi:hypothetical protein
MTDFGVFRSVNPTYHRACSCKSLSWLQLIPQIWTNWRTKATEGLPGSMMFLWALCKFGPCSNTHLCPLANMDLQGGVPFGAYGIIQNWNIPIQIQPQVFMCLCLTAWVQTLIYHKYVQALRPADWPTNIVLTPVQSLGYLESCGLGVGAGRDVRRC